MAGVEREYMEGTEIADMSMKETSITVNPITAFVIRKEESGWGLPPGEYGSTFIALGFGDDVDGEQWLWNTFSISEASCLDAARAAYPQALYIGREIPVARGERI